MTLLHVARTTKLLRELVMVQAARPTWKLAFSNNPDALPCPPDMDEPALADLIYSSHCHVRLDSRFLSVITQPYWGGTVLLSGSGRGSVHFTPIPRKMLLYLPTRKVRNLILYAYHCGADL